MSTKYIRVIKDGFIYDYNEILAKNPGCEVITEEEAYPERFIPSHALERVETAEKAKRAVRRKASFDLLTADIPEPPPYTSAELAADASRGLPE